ncbi:MAG: nucleotide-binding universal stress UspA family protein [Halobacteriales archaeon]|jgi:nucleotide-binding universal stress UspA family protein
MDADPGPVRTLADAGGAADRSDFRILVSVANPATCEKLIRTGSALAAANDGELLALSVAVTDAPGAIDSSDPEVESRQAVVDRAMAVAKDDENDVPTRGLVRAAESPAAGILDTSEAYDVDCVLLGWHGGRSSEAEVVIGNVVDEVSANTRRDLLVERVRGGIKPVDSVLVPIAGGIHSSLAVSTARDLALATDATITVATVVGPGATPGERDSYVEMLEEATADVDDLPVETRLLEGESIAETLVVESRDYDLTVMGATGTGSLEELLFDSVTAKVARGASGHFLIARRSDGSSGSRARRLLSKLFEGHDPG